MALGLGPEEMRAVLDEHRRAEEQLAAVANIDAVPAGLEGVARMKYTCRQRQSE